MGAGLAAKLGVVGGETAVNGRSSEDGMAPRDGGSRAQLTRVPFTHVHRLVRQFLEPVQDVLVVLLALVLFGVMLRALASLGANVLAPGPTLRPVVGDALFVLVLVELQRLLIIYLRDHHVSVDVMVEVAIVGTLREVLLLGPAEIEPVRLMAVTAFVLALGILLRFGDLRPPQRRIHYHGAGHGRRAVRRQRAVTPAG